MKTTLILRLRPLALTGAAVGVALGTLGGPRASAQMLNIDFGNNDGTPASTYGAAANQPGTWTTINTTGTPVALQNLDGTTSSGMLTLTATYSTGYNDYPAHAGDQHALLDDDFYSVRSSLWSVTISGLRNGTYSLYYYAPSSDYQDTGAFTANGVVANNITGSTSGFSQGVDWQVITGVVVSNGTLSLTNTENSAPYGLGLAGLQIVPEPSTWALLGLGGVGLLGLTLRRRAARA